MDVIEGLRSRGLCSVTPNPEVVYLNTSYVVRQISLSSWSYTLYTLGRYYKGVKRIFRFFTRFLSNKFILTI